jgi:radical SAM protein with 4Fe4S-binding SPASM domain
MKNLFSKVHDTLPVFGIEDELYSVLYTPGYFILLKNSYRACGRQVCSAPENIHDLSVRRSVNALLEHARQNQVEWSRMQQQPFSVESLTIHAGDECNFNCSYCYLKVSDGKKSKLSGFPAKDLISTSLHSVYKNEQYFDKPLTVVYHGSGEPTLHWKELTDTWNTIQDFAARKGIRLFHYIATNASLNQMQADWLAEHMNLVGISCDGPPELQNRLRSPAKPNALSVEGVCRRILEKGGRFDIRATITRETMMLQPEIVEYLIGKCQAQNIRIEPVYLAGGAGFCEQDADVFVRSYLLAGKYAQSKGVDISCSGVRIEEMHGTFCDVLRNNLRLMPDGEVRNCFCYSSGSDDLSLGRVEDHRFSLKATAALEAIKNKASMVPEECTNCINLYHCSRGCPDFCFFADGKDHKRLNAFRCRLHQLLTVTWIKELAHQKIVSHDSV